VLPRIGVADVARNALAETRAAANNDRRTLLATNPDDVAARKDRERETEGEGECMHVLSFLSWRTV